MLVSIPSNRPHRMRPCLNRVLKSLQKENIPEAEVLVVDGSNAVEPNRVFAKKASQAAGIAVQVVSENQYAKNSRDFGFLFQGPFGGPRNVALAQGALKGKPVVFLDDDIEAQPGFFSRFSDLLSDHGIVVGATSGRRTGSDLLMDKAHRALTDYAEGRLAKDKAAQGVREAFCGLSDDWPPTVEGFRSGCLGVSASVANQYCFFPTRFRAEDGLFCTLSRFFCDEEAFKPFLPDAPLGRHDPDAGSLDTLTRDYVSTQNGTALALSIQYLLLHFGRDFTPAALDLACRKGPEPIQKELQPARRAKRLEQHQRFLEALEQLQEPELSNAYRRFLGITEHDGVPSDLVAQVEQFFQVQSSWLRFLARQQENESPV